MLDLDLRRIFKMRGIKITPLYLMNNGFSRTTANLLMNYDIASIKFKHLEKLCRLFHCTPNDLLNWKQSENDAPIADDHPLHALRHERATELSHLIEELPLEKMSEVENFLRGLKEK